MQTQNVSTIETLPDGFTMRPPTLDDAQSIADTINAYVQSMVGRSAFSAEKVKGILTDPSTTLERDTRLIVNENNETVAYLGTWNSAPHVETDLVLRIHPDYVESPLRHILMEWGEALADENIARAPKDAQIIAGSWCFSDDKPAIAYLEKNGYTHSRNFYRMQVDLDQEIPAAQFPAHITLKTMAEINDLSKVYRAVDEVFQDHWGYVSEPEEEGIKDFQHWIDSSPNMDLNHWYLAMDEDEIAGISLCMPYLTGQEDVGYVDSLGVRPNWRRQGLALALLHYSFTNLKALGRKSVTLDVDASSLTGATRLYEKAGMRVVEHSMVWEKILREGKDYRIQELEG